MEEAIRTALENPLGRAYLRDTARSDWKVTIAFVEINRLVTDSDLTIYINTVVWRGFNGGWKSVCVGLGSYRCIRWHHTPDSMSMSNNSTGSATVFIPCTGS